MIDFIMDDKIKSYDPMMIKLCKRVFGFVDPEIMQTCRLATYMAINEYDPKRKIKESTFVYKLIYNNLISHLRHNNIAKNKAISLNQITNDDDDYIDDIQYFIEDKNTKTPFQNLHEKEIYDLLETLIKNYTTRHNRILDKTKNNLYDWLIHEKDHHHMIRQYGKKYESPRICFRDFVKRHIPKTLIEKHIKELDKWIKKERQKPELRRIGYRRTSLISKGGKKYHLKEDLI